MSRPIVDSWCDDMRDCPHASGKIRRDCYDCLQAEIDAAIAHVAISDIHTDGMARQWSEDSKAHAETMLRLAAVERERDEARAHLHIAGKRADEAERREDAARKRNAELEAALRHQRSYIQTLMAEKDGLTAYAMRIIGTKYIEDIDAALSAPVIQASSQSAANLDAQAAKEGEE